MSCQLLDLAHQYDLCTPIWLPMQSLALFHLPMFGFTKSLLMLNLCSGNPYLIFNQNQIIDD